MAANGKKIKEVLRPLVESIREGMGQNLIAMVLFGSRARGEQRRSSDWDIFVLARSLPVSPMKRHAQLQSFHRDEADGGVSFLAKTQIEFKETGLKRERIPGGFFWDWKKYPGPD